MLLTNMAWSMIYVEVKRMTMPKMLSRIVQKFWNEWELRLMLLLSLTLQLLLVYVGRGRVKFTGLKFTILAWLVYLLADWSATVVLSSLLRGGIDVDNSLIVFWTPFLLWHLGSPFNITAYSLEDNEIWLRHLLGMIIQSISALYVCVRFWRRSVLAFMAVPVLISGIFKYGERIWALRAASEKRLVDSIFSSKRLAEDVIGQKMIRTGMLSGGTEGVIEGERVKNLPRLDNLRLAHHSYQIFKPLFFDIHFEISKETFDAINISSKSPQDAFELVEIELRFLYDTLYTKVPLQQSKTFIAFHTFCFFSAVAALLGFSSVVGRSFFSSKRPSFHKVDVAVTYLLLTSAIALDIYSAVVLSVSNWTMVRWARPTNWLQRLYVKFVASRAGKRSSSKAERAKGGSEAMAQHDLVNYFVEKRQANVWSKSAGILDTANLMQKYAHTHWKPVTPDLKGFIFSSILEKMRKRPEKMKKESEEDPIIIRDMSWEKTTESFDEFVEKDIQKFLKPKGFIERVFTWHIATNMLYYSDHDTYPRGALGPYCDISKHLSDYMMYLVLMKPSMLPRGFNEVINRETCNEATQLFPRDQIMDHPQRGKGMGLRRMRKEFISSLLGVIKVTNAPVLVPGKKMSALLDGCFLASQLKELVSAVVTRRYDQEEKWEMVSRVWMEMMAYAASKCPWREHAKELIHGGELLSYVSLLMAHLGLTDQITPIDPDRLRDLQQSRLLQ